MSVFALHQLGDDFMEMTFDEKTVKFSMISIAGRGRLDGLIRKFVPNPLDLAKEACSGQPHEVARHIMDKAFYKRAFWPPSIESDEGMEAISRCYDLQVGVIHEMMRYYQPEATFEDAKKISDRLPIDTFFGLVRFAWTGLRPDEPDPKAPATVQPSIGST